MFGTAVTGEVTKRDLKWDDKAGAAYLYGAGSGQAPMGVLACSAVGAAPARGAVWIVIALIGLMFGRRRSDPRGD